MSVASAYRETLERLARAAERSGRDPAAVRLMAVSKFHGPEAVMEAYGAGARLFGESRVQEASAKFAPLIAGGLDPELHLIGSLQRNKAKAAAELFSCVQSADRNEIIVELGKRAGEAEKVLDLLLEMHTGEESKSGFPDADALARAVELCLSQPSLRLRGLMTMAPYTDDPGPIRASFRALSGARDFLASRFPGADFSMLSMGMTNDFEIAAEEGSTLVRVGTAIFGSRPAPGAAE